MAAFVVFLVVDKFGIRALCPTPRSLDNLVRKSAARPSSSRTWVCCSITDSVTKDGDPPIWRMKIRSEDQQLRIRDAFRRAQLMPRFIRTRDTDPRQSSLPWLASAPSH